MTDKNDPGHDTSADDEADPEPTTTGVPDAADLDPGAKPPPIPFFPVAGAEGLPDEVHSTPIPVDAQHD